MNIGEPLSKSYKTGASFSLVFLSMLLLITGCGNSGKPAEITHRAASRSDNAQALRMTDKFYDISLRDGGNMWVSGYYGVVVHSADYGKTWARRVPAVRPVSSAFAS